MSYYPVDIILFSPEVERLYEKAGVERTRVNEKILPPTSEVLSYDLSYPEFTEIKQFKLLKWLLLNKRMCIRKAEYSDNYYMDTAENRSNGVDSSHFDECLAGIVNIIWQNLTAKDKEEIKEILEGR